MLIKGLSPNHSFDRNIINICMLPWMAYRARRKEKAAMEESISLLKIEVCDNFNRRRQHKLIGCSFRSGWFSDFFS
ncbi:Uncharacterized protein APZ42_022343 [Daphnia magna]|uniref:Uncharacterized protein n=1 Tax=Daphnia magna TaxID=35525 RepID=A0A164VET7_9CRUS|nr:Uncharacterized protein APZ42_022343 [Daphnia magna]